MARRVAGTILPTNYSSGIHMHLDCGGGAVGTGLGTDTAWHRVLCKAYKRHARRGVPSGSVDGAVSFFGPGA
ncbi:hypothetical protein D3C80_1843060 [compost metagenome]